MIRKDVINDKEVKKVIAEYLLVEGGLSSVNVQNILKSLGRYEKSIIAVLLAVTAGVSGTKLYHKYYKIFGKYVARRTDAILRLIVIQYLQAIKDASEKAKKNDTEKLTRGAMRTLNGLIKALRNLKKPIAPIVKRVEKLDVASKLYTRLLRSIVKIEKTAGKPDKQAQAIASALTLVANNFKKFPINATLKAKLLPLVGYIKIKDRVSTLLSFLPPKLEKFFSKLLEKSSKPDVKEAPKKAKTLEEALKTLGNLKIGRKIPYREVTDGTGVVMEIDSDVFPEPLGEVVALAPDAYADKFKNIKLTPDKVEKITAAVAARIGAIDDYAKSIREMLKEEGAKKVNISFRVAGPGELADYPTDYLTAKISPTSLKRLASRYADAVVIQTEIARQFKPGSKAFALNADDGKWYAGTVKKVTKEGLIVFKPNKRGVKAFDVDPLADEIFKPKEYNEKRKSGEIDDLVPTVDTKTQVELENEPNLEDEQELLDFIKEEEQNTPDETVTTTIDDLLESLGE